MIDNSNVFRSNPVYPYSCHKLILTRLLSPPWGIVANPTCSTFQLVRVLKPLIVGFNVQQIILTTFQAASEESLKGVDELLEGSRSVIRGQTPPNAKRFPVPLAFNVIPQVGEIASDETTLEECKLVHETRKSFACLIYLHLRSGSHNKWPCGFRIHRVRRAGSTRTGTRVTREGSRRSALWKKGGIPDTAPAQRAYGRAHRTR